MYIYIRIYIIYIYIPKSCNLQLMDSLFLLYFLLIFPYRHRTGKYLYTYSDMQFQTVKCNIYFLLKSCIFLRKRRKILPFLSLFKLK